MDIGKRLRELREAKGLSQGHIEKRTGLFRCYVSRVECGHTIPKLETLGKWAKALGVTLGEFFVENAIPPKPVKVVQVCLLYNLPQPYEIRAGLVAHERDFPRSTNELSSAINPIREGRALNGVSLNDVRISLVTFSNCVQWNFGEGQD